MSIWTVPAQSDNGLGSLWVCGVYDGVDHVATALGKDALTAQARAHEIADARNAAYYKSLSDAAIQQIRDNLNAAGVPLAAFIDDHVNNAIALWKQSLAVLTTVAGAGADACLITDCDGSKMIGISSFAKRELLRLSPEENQDQSSKVLGQ